MKINFSTLEEFLIIEWDGSSLTQVYTPHARATISTNFLPLSRFNIKSAFNKRAAVKNIDFIARDIIILLSLESNSKNILYNWLESHLELKDKIFLMLLQQ